MAADAKRAPATFDPTAFAAFRFLTRELDAKGRVTLRYALDEEIFFVEEFDLPIEGELSEEQRESVGGLLSLLHWVAGVSYFKTALPPRVSFESDTPAPAVAALLEALYSEGLGELAYTNELAALPRPSFGASGERDAGASTAATSTAVAGEEAAADDTNADRDPTVRAASGDIERVLVPVGGGKDSAVAIEIARRSGREVALFSIGDAPPITRTVAVAGLPHLLVRRRLDPGLRALNEAGAINGHVPITAIVSCVALLTAALHGFDAVAMANERSASSGNVRWDGVEVNHQFSKGLRAERLLSSAVAETEAGVGIFSLLRPASELAIARAFARMDAYHPAFTSCNAIFRLDPALRAASWCCDCPKCRFVFLALAPFSEPGRLREIFGADLLADERQFEGFALLTATGGHKPFECVGEEQESLAAIRLLARDPRWSGHVVVRRLVDEVLGSEALVDGDGEGGGGGDGEGQGERRPAPQGEDNPDAVLALSDEHDVPTALMADVRAVLGA